MLYKHSAKTDTFSFSLIAKCKSRNQDRLNWSYNFITIHLVPTIFRRKKKSYLWIY